MPGSLEIFRRRNLGSGRQSGGFHALSDIEYEKWTWLTFQACRGRYRRSYNLRSGSAISTCDSCPS